MQRVFRKVRWDREYLNSPLAWYALVDRALFRRTYTGKETLHSYMALRYRDCILHAKDASGRTDAVAKTEGPARDQGVA